MKSSENNKTKFTSLENEVRICEPIPSSKPETSCLKSIEYGPHDIDLPGYDDYLLSNDYGHDYIDDLEFI